MPIGSGAGGFFNDIVNRDGLVSWKGVVVEKGTGKCELNSAATAPALAGCKGRTEKCAVPFSQLESLFSRLKSICSIYRVSSKVKGDTADLLATFGENLDVKTLAKSGMYLVSGTGPTCVETRTALP